MLPWPDRLISTTLTLERAASMMFVLGITRSRSQIPRPRSSHGISRSRTSYLPILSAQATLDRNSQFYRLTDEDREKLGGIEYRSLKLLLKIVTSLAFICSVQFASFRGCSMPVQITRNTLQNAARGKPGAQTMVNNLGFTLTPDSMIHFQDATYPLLLMSFLAYAGNTCYPCLLRLVIWIMFKLCPEYSSRKESLGFLLSHPRRCYTLLFPSQPTWLLFRILVAMNLIDVVLILVLDLHISAVSHLPLGQRIIAALFQAASSRHTGTSIFNLADVNPAVQFSLLVMMYISIFPIALSVRASNVYEEEALGVYSLANEIDESDSRSYLLTHIRNQLTFDLWYIFLGIFCICIAEAERIMANSDPAFSVFSVFFEVISAYGNVGLSLGYPTVSTSLSGQFTTFSKLVICAMMVRGRHRGLPYKLDRAIVLPTEHLMRNDTEGDSGWRGGQVQQLAGIRRIHTS
ncbi:hypothetical protein N7510_000415 [Penicillium lagena]|uniref:uncharacterized protein n=1 Tax=Penicillium lagena TaxID=94218 RepID=UPI0025402780|nr:uncharacterized protein N7510_000415 [Penicillium lagena]KAJ5624106.1 hypothetical protein N7510_000415 [Penicillium lagena]